jgi:hypothetical protein
LKSIATVVKERDQRRKKRVRAGFEERNRRGVQREREGCNIFTARDKEWRMTKPRPCEDCGGCGIEEGELSIASQRRWDVFHGAFLVHMVNDYIQYFNHGTLSKFLLRAAAGDFGTLQ